ncbi:MAG: choloylglycine hydrolase [Clostridia bacterium]|nr:choloylglycine hydrolase [Clostridia bacterium]
MCTAIVFNSDCRYFGRNLDFEHSFGEKITLTPRNFPISFSNNKTLTNHFAIIGMAAVSENYPLYFDATNEKGLSMAGLLFPRFSYYHRIKPHKTNIAPYEVILWVLSQCETVTEAKILLENVSIADIHFSNELPNTPLHWIICDKTGCIVLESVKEGLFIYDNPVGVLTNSPSFPMQIFNLNNYMSLSTRSPENHFSKKLDLWQYSRGMGGVGLPGDLSSQSRFVRGAFTALNSHCYGSEQSAVCQFFHILQSVAQTRGCAEVENGEYEITLYSSCVNTDKGIYYYTTYENPQICAVCMHKENLDSEDLITYGVLSAWNVRFQN